MDKSIEEQNKNFINEWIKINPNFSELNFSDNSILFSNNYKIELNDFLISSLLENYNISSNIYSMDEYLFYKILYANTQIYNYYTFDNDSNEYIKHIKLTNRATSEIVTNRSTIEIDYVQPHIVIDTFRILSKNNANGYVLLSDLYNKIGKPNVSNKKNDIIFFDLLEKENLDLKEMNYIDSFSKYMYTLMCYQDYLVGDAKHILDLYNYKMNYLLSLDNINLTQKRALNFYNDNVKSFELKMQKETFSEKKASVGFTSLALLIISVIVTLSLVLLLIIIH